MKKPKILLVEDEESFQFLLEMTLSEEYEIIQAKTYAEAEKAFSLHKEELDVIIMDRNLGPRTTDSLVEDIRKSGFSKPMIAFSGSGDSRKKQMELGCSDELPKTASKKEVIEKLNSIIK